MNRVNIEGIFFTENALNHLKEWFNKPMETFDTFIETDIEGINKLQSFLLRNWDFLDDICDDGILKIFVTNLQVVKDNLSKLSSEIKIDK